MLSKTITLNLNRVGGHFFDIIIEVQWEATSTIQKRRNYITCGNINQIALFNSQRYITMFSAWTQLFWWWIRALTIWGMPYYHQLTLEYIRFFTYFQIRYTWIGSDACSPVNQAPTTPLLISHWPGPCLLTWRPCWSPMSAHLESVPTDVWRTWTVLGFTMNGMELKICAPCLQHSNS